MLDRQPGGSIAICVVWALLLFIRKDSFTYSYTMDSSNGNGPLAVVDIYIELPSVGNCHWWPSPQSRWPSSSQYRSWLGPEAPKWSERRPQICQTQTRLIRLFGSGLVIPRLSSKNSKKKISEGKLQYVMVATC